LAGWQIFTPVGAYGAHRRLQQSLQSPHTVPLTPWQKAAPSGIAPHVPSTEPAAIVHVALQHSLAEEHTSPTCEQNDAANWHVPFEQSEEQHSLFAAQLLPAVRHALFSGVQAPEVHLPPQHSASLVHAPLSETHCVPEHVPFVHEREQHAVEAAHAALPAKQTPNPLVHVCSVASHTPEQHSALAPQFAPLTPHERPMDTAAPSPPVSLALAPSSALAVSEHWSEGLFPQSSREPQAANPINVSDPKRMVTASVARFMCLSLIGKLPGTEGADHNRFENVRGQPSDQRR